MVSSARSSLSCPPAMPPDTIAAYPHQANNDGTGYVDRCEAYCFVQAAKDWGWREFVTLTSLFDIDAGFLVNDAVVFSAEVRCQPNSRLHANSLPVAQAFVRVCIGMLLGSFELTNFTLAG